MYLLIFIVWLILNGKFTLEVFLTGMVLTAGNGILFYSLFGYSIGRELAFLRKVPLFFAYLFVLLWEILKASLSVIRFILNEKNTIEPTLGSFRSGLKTRFGRYVLANSITLTPGTITVFQEDDHFVIHCLRKEFAEGIEHTVFADILGRLKL